MSNLEAWANYQENGKLLAEQVENVLRETGAEKVNLIGHSKGGIDARYAISKLGLANKVASLTTISTPHRGTSPADILAGIVPDTDNVLYKLTNFFGKIMGDKYPDAAAALQQLTHEHMQKFNQEITNVDDVYYQSYGTTMLKVTDAPFFSLTYEILNQHEGENDGMVSVSSYRWGEFQGIVQGKIKNVGISHLQITGSMGKIISNINIPVFYATLVCQIKEKGF